MMTAVIVYASFALAVYINHRINMYIDTKEQKRLEDLERDLEERHLDAIMQLMF